MKKFVAVMNIPSPYRLHLLGELSRQLEAKGISFHCHFMNRGHKDRPKSWLNPQIPFAHTYWRNFGSDQHEFNPRLVMKLLFSRPDYLILGSPFETITGILVAHTCRAKTKICWVEGNAKSPGKLTGLVGKIKVLTLSCFRYMALPGKQGEDYRKLLSSLTTRAFPSPVVLPNLVDESRFGHSPCDKKRCFGVGDSTRVAVLPVRFDPVKGLKEFFRVVEPTMLEGWKLVVMGHGPEEEKTMRIVVERGLSKFVEVIHSVPYDEMPQHYASADLCIIPSMRDQNPLAAVEALHSGLPLALSDQAGNVDEAVTPGKNGWVLPVMNADAYHAELTKIFATSLGRLREMGTVSVNVNAKFWDTKKSIAKFVEKVTCDL